MAESEYITVDDGTILGLTLIFQIQLSVLHRATVSKEAQCRDAEPA